VVARIVEPFLLVLFGAVVLYLLMRA